MAVAVARSIQSKTLAVKDYNLADTLQCGQAFRWRPGHAAWEGVIGEHWIQVSSSEHSLTLSTTSPSPDWAMFRDYFQADLDIEAITEAFPKDTHLKDAVHAFRGLRLLKQPPWECLASFILSSTKQIPHIQAIIERISSTYGSPLPVPDHALPRSTFPSAEALSQRSENDLRKLGMGYRAPYLLQAAQAVASGDLPLHTLETLPYAEAKQALQSLHGVGPKIADCVLLFSCGMQSAFPIDVWVKRALSELYFQDQNPTPAQLEDFASHYFGPYAGYAQQYLFHYRRTQGKPPARAITH